MRRLAFTLVELLTVLAIIGILIGILLPSVQMVREAGRRAVCQNNIRQIAIGLENYHSQSNRYPFGWNELEGRGHSGWSWLSYTLPYLEEDNIYQQIDFNIRMTDQSHEHLLEKRVENLFCPSSRDFKINEFLLKGEVPEEVPSNQTFEFPVSLARTQYVGCIGSIFTPRQIENGL